MTNKGDPAYWHCEMHEGFLNGVTARWADTAQTKEERARVSATLQRMPFLGFLRCAPSDPVLLAQTQPVVLFMHGFPESWFSWRHQMKAVHEAGYRGIAPYMRGYGEPNAEARLTDVAEYNVYRLAGDMLALLQRVGAEKAALVGHDHGAGLGWSLALLHPAVFTIYCAMSVPLFPRQPGSPPPIEGGMRKIYGDERGYHAAKPETNPNFFYQLHHQLDSAEVDYAKDSRKALMAMGFGDPRKPGARPPPVSSKKLFVEEDGATRSPAAWERGPQPAALHDWITEPEFEYYVKDFEAHGWNGGLCWYRVMDINAASTPQFVGAKAKQPCQFITGTQDVVVAMLGRDEKGEMSCLSPPGASKRP